MIIWRERKVTVRRKYARDVQYTQVYVDAVNDSARFEKDMTCDYCLEPILGRERCVSALNSLTNIMYFFHSRCFDKK